MKLSADGSALGKPESTELAAIKKGISFFLSNPWSNSHSLIIQGDSRNIVNWVNNHNSVPWRMKSLSNSIEVLKCDVKAIIFKHIFREENNLAGGLVKQVLCNRVNSVQYFNASPVIDLTIMIYDGLQFIPTFSLFFSMEDGYSFWEVYCKSLVPTVLFFIYFISACTSGHE
ncbi:Uncharacterized protein TCM_007423 [Theobroma cacao]|uniref:RNase H type-1 domain-containing protein n=1 Tax=Theobroma cacao TaxID=3641 RepID=A0A061E907_THECC|nr:Uncharacterized protein TCM_007423 [Theobroma cacao]